MAEPDQQSSAANDNDNRRRLNQARRGDQSSSPENEPESSPEAARARELGAGAPMEGVSESAGLTGGSLPGASQFQSPGNFGFDQAGPGPAEKAGSASQAAGAGMELGGKGMKLGGKAMKAGGELAGKGIGGAVGGAGGALTGALGGPQGMLAGARAGAKAGSMIGGKAGKLPGQAMEKAGQGVEKAGKKTKSFSRRLRDKTRQEREGKAKGPAAQGLSKAKTLVTSRLLQSAWLSQFAIVGLVTAFWALFWWLYMIIHFLAAYLTPLSDYFCKFGEEWTNMAAPKALTEGVGKKMNKRLEIAEISLFLLLSLLYIIIIFILVAVVGIIIYAWTHQWAAIKLLGLTALKLVWGRIIGKY